MAGVTMTIRKPVMDLLKQGCTQGLAELAQEVVIAATPGKPRKAEAHMVATLDGKVVAGEGAPPRGSLRGMVAFAVFGYPSHIVELGTAAHGIKPKKRGKKQALAFDGKFFAHVQHPATAAKPFINPAVIAVTGRSQPILRRGIRKRWKG